MAGIAAAGVCPDDPPNRLMISSTLDLDAGVGADVAGAEVLPKMSARRSCVFWADAAVTIGVDVVDDSSPMRSTSESLSVRVDPTVLFSETVYACYQHVPSSSSNVFHLPVPIIVALISGAGMCSKTPPTKSLLPNRLVYSIALCCSSRSGDVPYEASISVIRSCWKDALVELASANLTYSLASAVRVN